MGTRNVSVTSISCSVEPRDHPFQPANETLPPVTRTLVEALVFRPEARLLHAHEDAALCRRQRPGNDGPQSVRCLLAGRVPAIGEPFTGFHDQNLADDAVPLWHRLGAEIESVAHDRLEIVLHQPLLDQRTLREGAPYLFRRVRHFSFNDERTRGGGFGRGCAHWSILLSESARVLKRLSGALCIQNV